jgi:hypothetical protein
MHLLSRLPGALPLAALLLVALVVEAAAAVIVPPAGWLVDQVKVLAAPEMDGRRAGTPGADRAAAHVAAEFQRAGLAPGGEAGSYFQSLDVPTGIRLGAPNTMALVGPGGRALALAGDFVPLAVSADGRVEGPVVFAGYGITAPDLGYDDYAGLDVRGAVVVVLEGTPGGEGAQALRNPDAYHHGDRGHKVINAREHGARAAVLVAHPSSSDTLPALRGLSQPLGALAVAVTRPAADALLRPAGRRLAEAAAGIDRAGRPASFAVPGAIVRLEIALVRERAAARNVVGVLAGTDPRVSHEAIVVGAHYDHLGRGGEGSLAPEAVGRIHHGADDNASGTAAVIALARAFAAAGGAPRTLVFVAFTGEELGLLGSTHYVRHAAHPVERTILMVNLDMVGRLRDGRLYVAGVDSGSGLRALVTAQAGGLDLKLRGDPYAPSDHTAFYQAGRPVLFFFTGAHADYHRPSDTWDRIDGAGLQAVASLVAGLVRAVAAEAVPPTYVKVEAPASSGRRGGSGYGPFFGVVPEFGEDGSRGVKIGGVRGGSPAEKAGVRSGDRLVGFAGVDVKTLEDLVFALRRQRAGDRVEVVVQREGAEHRFEAVLEERRE